MASNIARHYIKCILLKFDVTFMLWILFTSFQAIQFYQGPSLLITNRKTPQNVANIFYRIFTLLDAYIDVLCGVDQA